MRAVWLVLLVPLACVTPPPTRADIPDCPVPLVASGEMGAFRLRYHVAVASAPPAVIQTHFDLVAESRRSVLTLVAWNRFGAQLFALRQEGVQVERVGPVLPGFPVSPERILADFQRLRFRGTSAAAPDGTRIVSACGTETRFAQIAGDPP